MAGRVERAVYPGLVESPEAFLIDIYDTMITCDFTVFNPEMGRLAGVSAAAWRAGYEASVGSGVVTIAARMAEILAHCGVPAEPELVARLAARDGELLRATCRLYDDVLPFLRLLRDRGVKIAVVSNCDEHTPSMLAATGVTALADAMSYSCEVGCLSRRRRSTGTRLTSSAWRRAGRCSSTTSRRSARRRPAWAWRRSRWSGTRRSARRRPACRR